MGIDQENCGDSPCDPTTYTLPNGKPFAKEMTPKSYPQLKDEYYKFLNGRGSNDYYAMEYPDKTNPLYQTSPYKYDEVCS